MSIYSYGISTLITVIDVSEYNRIVRNKMVRNKKYLYFGSMKVLRMNDLIMLAMNEKITTFKYSYQVYSTSFTFFGFLEKLLIE